MNFPLILIGLTLIFSIICAIDYALWAPKRNTPQKPTTVEYARSFLPVLLLVLIIRSFVMQLYWVPTGSLEPTVERSELLLVTQYNYNLHLPLLETPLFHTGDVKRFDIIVFRWPVNPSVHLVKRVIGLPGDDISYINKVLYINGEKATQTFIGVANDANAAKNHWPVKLLTENLNAIPHKIYTCLSKATCPNHASHDFYHLTVPKNQYFFMGDNRDNSDDSRAWGFVPRNNLVGKAQVIIASWDSVKHRVRWKRIGTIL